MYSVPSPKFSQRAPLLLAIDIGFTVIRHTACFPTYWHYTIFFNLFSSSLFVPGTFLPFHKNFDQRSVACHSECLLTPSVFLSLFCVSPKGPPLRSVYSPRVLLESISRVIVLHEGNRLPRIFPITSELLYVRLTHSRVMILARSRCRLSISSDLPCVEERQTTREGRSAIRHRTPTPPPTGVSRHFFCLYVNDRPLVNLSQPWGASNLIPSVHSRRHIPFCRSLPLLGISFASSCFVLMPQIAYFQGDSPTDLNFAPRPA